LEISENGLVLDSCVIINLLCADLFEPFLEIFQDVKIAEFVKTKEIISMENKYVFSQEYLSGRLLVPNESESELILELSKEVDDGEAYSIALAISRGYDFGTDDKKAIRVFNSFPDHQKIWSTPELVFRVLENSGESFNKQDIIKKIQDNAKYIPHPAHPHYKEWMEILNY